MPTAAFRVAVEIIVAMHGEDEARMERALDLVLLEMQEHTLFLRTDSAVVLAASLSER